MSLCAVPMHVNTPIQKKGESKGAQLNEMLGMCANGS